MVRMFKSLLTITCIVFAGTAYGLGLGEITLKSALNQPLLAEIELLQEEGMYILLKIRQVPNLILESLHLAYMSY